MSHGDAKSKTHKFGDTLHIKARTGSQTPVVTIYGHTISHIWRTNYSETVF